MYQPRGQLHKFYLCRQWSRPSTSSRPCSKKWGMDETLQLDMYPRVKVRKQVEEDDQYAYEKISLQSVKAFEWLSLNDFSSSDESPPSIVRVRGSNVPKSPISTCTGSKGEENNKTKTVSAENRKNVRASSVPRPRAVLSSPDNDGIIGSKTKTRRELHPSTKSHNTCQNRHTQHKVFPRSTAAESFGSTLVNNKEASERKNDPPAKGRAVPPDSSLRSGPLRRKPQYPVKMKLIS
ncbi:unnamed protein product [Fraxinus pennsylvanica]|uniref:Uncharacterized protein n=1 Tax=Fraxinus pennsylvanica TaxID=56036 RepID=A0AAD1ZUX5_9LAMI|nr:unnamed protein product [Fraxinus pennsylvanica]